VTDEEYRGVMINVVAIISFIAVLHDVLKRFLGNSVKSFFCRVVYVGFRFGHDLNVELVPCSDRSGEATQPGHQPFLGNALGPQSEDQRAELHKRCLRLIDDVVERLDQPGTLWNPFGRPSRGLSSHRNPIKCLQGRVVQFPRQALSFV